MADKKIKGITIAMQADTSGVAKGLKDVTAESVKFSAQLKQVEALLKLDPTNTDLLAEREKLLSASTEKTAEKLSMLRAAQEDVNKAFAEGKINDSEYIAFQNELVRTEQRLQSLQQQTQKTKTPLEALESTIADQKKKLSELGKEYQNAVLSEGQNSDAAKALEQQYKQLDSELKTNQAQLKSSQDAAASLSAEEKKALTPLESLKATISDQKKELDRLSDEYKNAVLSEGENSGAAKELAKQMQSLTAEQKDNQKQLDDLENATKNATGTTDDFDDSVKELGNDSEKASGGISAATIAVGEFLGNLAMDVLKDATSALGDFMKDVVDTGSELESKLSDAVATIGYKPGDFGVDALTGELKDGSLALEELTSKAKEIGRTTEFTSAQAAEAFNFMAMAGWDTEEMISGLDGVIYLASASGEELGTVSDIVTDAMTALGLSADGAATGVDNVTFFADTLAATASSANTNVAILGESFQYVAPVIGAFSTDEESAAENAQDLAVALGLMANAGIKGSQAGNSLKNSIVNLTKPTAAQAEAMKQLGLITGEYETVIDPEKITKAQNDVENATVSLTAAQSRYDEMIQKYGESSTQAISASASLTKAQNALEEAQISLNEAQEGTVEFSAGYNAAIQDADGNMRSLGDIMGVLRQSLGAVNVELTDSEGNMREYEDIIGEVPESVAEQLEYAATLFGKQNLAGMLAIINATEEDYESLTEAIEDSAGAAKDMAAVKMDNLAGDVTYVESAFSGLKESIYDNVNTPLRTFAQDVYKEILPALTGIVEGSDGASEALAEAISNLVQDATDILPDMMGLAESILSGIADGVLSALPDLIPLAVDLVMALVQGIVTALPRIAEAATTMMDALLASLTNVLPDLIPAAVQAVVMIAQGLVRNIPKLIEGALQLVGALADGLAAGLPVLLDALPDIIIGLVSGLLSHVGEIVQAGIMLLTGLVGALPEIISTILGIVPEILNSLTENLLSHIGEMIDTGITLLIALVEAMPDIINSIVDVLPEIITAVIDALLVCIPQIIEAGVRLLTALVDNLPEIIGQIIAVVPQIIASVSSALIAKYPEIREMGMRLFVELIAKSAEIIRKLLEMPRQIIEHIKNAFMERFSDMQQIGMELFSNIANGIRSVLGDAWTWGADLIDNFVNGIRDKIGQLADIAADCAETVKNFLGFSEPEEGPLSNFHTFAPDMMELFAQGIKENEHLIADQFRKSLGNIGIAADLTAMSPAMVTAGGGVVNNYYNNDNSQTFTQNNTSPKALSRWELNRQARNILELAKR